MTEFERVPITSLNEYLNIISEFRRKLSENEGTAEQRLFFRGQENETWPVTPSVFRNDYLSIEGKIIRLALSRSPGEFRDHTTSFERLTKLQHYGLSTRLIDVTLNPLVAMYFACLPCDEYSEVASTEIETDIDYKCLKIPRNGAIYYKREYEMYHDSEEVKIISVVAGMDIKKDTEINELIKLLSDHGMDYQTPERIEKLFKILQGNYFVLCNQNNERLIRQSGAFLIPGAININKQENLMNTRISKGIANLQSEFYEEVFVIDYQKKEEILEELDFYNINEATLFPELEHQMNYIKRNNGKYATSVSPFSKLESEVKRLELEKISDDTILSNEDLIEALIKIIDEVLDNKSPELRDELLKAFIENAGVDWYKREQLQADIKHHLFNTIKLNSQFTRPTGKKMAERILDNAITAIFDADIKQKSEKIVG